jgi:iron complex transport system substrate-binding protein
MSRLQRLLALFVLVAAASPAWPRPAVVVADDAGGSVTLAAAPRRIVSLAPHATELLFALGAGARIVGVSAASDWPPEARVLPRIGDARAIDLERVFALAPDLVVTWPYTAPAQAARLKARGVPVFVLDARTIGDLPGQMSRLGRLVGEARRGEALATATAARLDALRARYRNAAPVAVFYQIWNAPLFTIGGGHLITQAIELCGGSNAFAGETLPAPMVSLEAVLAARPDVIVAGADGGRRPPWLDDWRRWPTLPAVAHGQLHAVDADLLHRPGPRFIDGVDGLCAAIDGARMPDRSARAALGPR